MTPVKPVNLFTKTDKLPYELCKSPVSDPDDLITLNVPSGCGPSQ